MPVITFHKKKIDKLNILQLAGLRQSIPSSLRHKDCLPPLNFPTFVIHDNIFDATTTRSTKFYALVIKEKAQLSYIAYKLQSDFNLSSIETNLPVTSFRHSRLVC